LIWWLAKRNCWLKRRILPVQCELQTQKSTIAPHQYKGHNVYYSCLRINPAPARMEVILWRLQFWVDGTTCLFEKQRKIWDEVWPSPSYLLCLLASEVGAMQQVFTTRLQMRDLTNLNELSGKIFGTKLDFTTDSSMVIICNYKSGENYETVLFSSVSYAWCINFDPKTVELE
jgi:hypothetical protein